MKLSKKRINTQTVQEKFIDHDTQKIFISQVILKYNKMQLPSLLCFLCLLVRQSLESHFERAGRLYRFSHEAKRTG
jgi:hypothetical protein